MRGGGGGGKGGREGGVGSQRTLKRILLYLSTISVFKPLSPRRYYNSFVIIKLTVIDRNEIFLRWTFYSLLTWIIFIIALRFDTSIEGACTYVYVYTKFGMTLRGRWIINNCKQFVCTLLKFEARSWVRTDRMLQFVPVFYEHSSR